MSTTIADIAASVSAKVAAEKGSDATREQITRIAAEFESMLMLQMLKEMRKSGSWDDDSDREHDAGSGNQTMLETIDVELAGHLAKAQSFGLAQQMLRVLDAGKTETAPTQGAALPGAHVDAHVSGAQGRAELALPEGKVTSEFGWRRDPFTGAARFHQGIDIRAAYGQDVQTAGPGRVIAAGIDGGYGETVVIEHAGGVRTRYAHLSAALVAPGDEVASGQVIGRAGHSGRATGTHLHFELSTANGDRVDPAQIERFKAEGLVADLTVGINPAQERRTE